jgi:hypothetical protein
MKVIGVMDGPATESEITFATEATTVPSGRAPTAQKQTRAAFAVKRNFPAEI